jgi:DnaJ family protein C protein 17
LRNLTEALIARKFHELNQAYELLLDPLRRLALDAKLRAKEARKLRFAAYDNKRKNLVDELEQRERAFKKAKMDKEQEELKRWHESEEIKEKGRQLREQREKEIRLREDQQKAAASTEDPEEGAPSIGLFNYTSHHGPFIDIGRSSRYYGQTQICNLSLS